MPQQHLGFILGFLAISAFGLTLPVTRSLSVALDPWFIGFGRAAVAGVAAGMILCWSRISFPPKSQWRSLLIVAAGVVLGFPLFSSSAMQLVPAYHGGVVLAILPLLTALFGRFFAAEHPSISFWFVSLLGGGLVSMYLLAGKDWRLHPGDLLLLLAAISAAVGYAVGGQLSKLIPGWQVICWALVLALPLTLPVFILRMPEPGSQIFAASWPGFLYLALVSQLFAFFLWYRGLALGGIARISQVQLIQPFVTLAAAAMWLGESLDSNALWFAIMIVTTVLIGQKMPVHQRG